MSETSGFLSWCKRHVTLPAIAVAAFLVYLLFFNSNSCSRLNELKGEINRLEKEISRNNDSVEHYRQLNRMLDTDPATLERIGRENYLMHAPDEDLFIVE